ncbi:hypothetical protein FACS1894182_14750 [Bacteroidia bacterium]|nr:hypothetical protein FACS1894182_14750 [Bacteroidia bacterium]
MSITDSIISDNSEDPMDSPPSTVSFEDDTDVYIQLIDSKAFISYWEKFRIAILEHDTTSLSSMMNDSIIGGWFLLRDYTKPLEKVKKSMVLENLYTLFTPAFLSLLSSYDIHKDLFSKQNEFGEKEYQCRQNTGGKTYHANITFYTGYYNVVCYSMGRYTNIDYPEDYVTSTNNYIFVEKDFGGLDNITFSFEFVQTQKGIKLNRLDFSSISVAGG